MIAFDRIPKDFAERYRREGFWRGEVLGDLLRPWAGTQPSRIAAVDAAGRWTYAQLDEQVDRVAAGLNLLGIVSGDCVVVQLPNTVTFPIVTIALFRIGAVPVFALPTHRRTEIEYLCEYSEAVAYVIPDVYFGFDYRALARDVVGSSRRLRHVIVDGDAQEFVPLRQVEAGPRSFDRPDPATVAFFLLSGGTTGLPKLIPRTHDDYSYQLRATAEGSPVRTGRSLLGRAAGCA